MIVKQYTLNRKTYKDVKRMDHQQMDAFCKNPCGRYERCGRLDRG